MTSLFVWMQIGDAAWSANSVRPGREAHLDTSAVPSLEEV